MKLIKPGYYWVKTITLYNLRGKRIFTESDDIEPARYTLNDRWEMIDSEKMFKTFTNREEMKYLETQIIVKSKLIKPKKNSKK